MRYFLRGSRCYLWLKNIDCMVCLKNILVSECISDRFDTVQASGLSFSSIFHKGACSHRNSISTVRVCDLRNNLKSTKYNTAHCKCANAVTACISIVFLSSNGLSKIPGVSITCHLKYL